MAADQGSTSTFCQEAMRHWGVTPIEYLGCRLNEHWLVASGEARLVLRAYPDEPLGDIGYELEVLRRLDALGWPVPVAVEEPLYLKGRTWCLLRWLPGTSLSSSPEEKRARGRLLAEFHESTVGFADMGQRDGYCLSDELTGDPELADSLREYERICPAEGHVMRWHLEKAQDAFARAEMDAVETLVLHSDFTPWNLLFEGGKLTGILDFESTHLNYRVADFALSWRGRHDEVIEGYQEVRKLTDPELDLIAPVLWSWCLLGAKSGISEMLSGNGPVPDFTWSIDHLLQRSRLLGPRVPQYPGR